MECGRLWTAHSLKIRTLFGNFNIYTVLYLPMLPAYAGVYAGYLHFSAFENFIFYVFSTEFSEGWCNPHVDTEVITLSLSFLRERSYL